MKMTSVACAVFGATLSLAAAVSYAEEPQRPDGALLSFSPAKGLATPISEDTLSEHRGGALDASVNVQSLTSTVAGNIAENTVSGANVIGEGAFVGSSGLPMIIQNSGNNVSIQNATVLNVTIK